MKCPPRAGTAQWAAPRACHCAAGLCFQGHSQWRPHPCRCSHPLRARTHTQEKEAAELQTVTPEELMDFCHHTLLEPAVRRKAVVAVHAARGVRARMRACMRMLCMCVCVTRA